MILKEIRTSYILARKYVERCCIKVEQDGKEIQAFTECEGKMRVTDWGGTSSALYLLDQIGDSGTIDIAEKIKLSSEWLLADQADEGSWEAAEMQCCEATAAVIYDLNNMKLLSKRKLEKAIAFVQRCYVEGKGYFTSRPQIRQIPHIYTTYLAVRALSITKHLSFTTEQKKQIISWIDSLKLADDKWNSTANYIEGDVAHTVFALLILYYAGISIKNIKKQYHKQIKWLKQQIKNCSTINGAFSYEATETYVQERLDNYGEGAFILKSYHFNTALLCHFFIKIRKFGIAQRLIKKLIKLRGQQDGWGLNSANKIFVWATQQAIDCMHEYETIVLKNRNSVFGGLKSIIYSVPYFGVKAITMLILVPIIFWLLKDAHKGADVVLSIIMMIVPWLVKTED